MMNSTIVNKLSLYLVFFLLFSSSCFCSDTAVPPAQPQAKVIPPPDDPKPKNKKKADPNKCPMEWVQPGGAGYSGELSQTGKTPFEWTEHPDAGGYELEVTQPDGSTIPYKSDDASQDLYMENYKAAGDYQAKLSALDDNGQVICSISLTFNKPAVDPVVGGSGNDGSGHPVITIPDVDVPR